VVLITNRTTRPPAEKGGGGPGLTIANSKAQRRRFFAFYSSGDPCLENGASIAAEDRLWKQRRHDEVRRVDHIGYAKIDGNAAEDISLLSAKPTLLQ
jgi:hypothetical protein